MKSPSPYWPTAAVLIALLALFAVLAVSCANTCAGNVPQSITTTANGTTTTICQGAK